MSMSTVTVRVDEQTKKGASDVLEDLGLDVSTAVRMFLRQVFIRGQLPIELLQDPFYSEASQSALHDSIRQLGDGRVVVKTLDELRAME